MQQTIYNFAQVYGASSYDSSTYDVTSGTSAVTTASPPGDTSGTANSGGLLTNTGLDIAAAASLACLIIFAALVVKFWKRPATQEVPIDRSPRG